MVCSTGVPPVSRMGFQPMHVCGVPRPLADQAAGFRAFSGNRPAVVVGVAMEGAFRVGVRSIAATETIAMDARHRIHHDPLPATDADTPGGREERPNRDIRTLFFMQYM